MMIRANRMQSTYMMRGEVPVDRKRLEELECKARAHDAYLAATQIMSRRHYDVCGKMQDAMANGASSKVSWSAGWIAALREFSEAVVDAARRTP